MNILIDIGGTNTRIAYTDNQETFSEPIIFPTPQHFDEWFAIAVKHIDELSGSTPIDSIVAGVAATFLSDHATIHTSPHLPAWQGINLQEKLGGWFNCKAHIENDTVLVGLGEATFGAGIGYDIMVYLTLSTGVGGVRIVNGKIDRNKFGFEIGHQIVNGDKELEYYLAGSSHEKRFGMPSHTIKDADFWKEVTHYAGILAANTTMYWSPTAIVFGGPVINDLNIKEIEVEAKKFLHMYEATPIFLNATLKNLGGLYGGLARLKDL